MQIFLQAMEAALGDGDGSAAGRIDIGDPRAITTAIMSGGPNMETVIRRRWLRPTVRHVSAPRSTSMNQMVTGIRLLPAAIRSLVVVDHVVERLSVDGDDWVRRLAGKRKAICQS